MTVTHVIYHVPGRKVGCSKDLDKRKLWYRSNEGSIPEIEVLEELHNKTDQEAGDIEWQWADRFGYKRGVHYVRTIEALKSFNYREFGRKGGRKGGPSVQKLRTPEQRSEFARMGGARTAELGLSGFKRLTSEWRRVNGKESGRKGGTQTARLGKSHFQTMSFEDRMTNARKAGSIGGRKGGKRTGELGKSGFQAKGVCPHCGFNTSVVLLHRWHNDNCRHKSS